MGYCPSTTQRSNVGRAEGDKWAATPLLFPNQLPAAAAKPLQSYPTLCDPIDSSPPGSPSLGFSRQEHWSGLPFPSPMRESEVAQSYPTLRPQGLQPTRPSVHGIFQSRVLEWVAIAFSNQLPNLEQKPKWSQGRSCDCAVR